jgi:formylglycine-generating enzyme required for sulfatase activity
MKRIVSGLSVFLSLFSAGLSSAQAASTMPVIKMINIPAGSFIMGDTAAFATPMHKVGLSAFAIGETDITQAQYQAVMGTNPSSFKTGTDAPNRPVETVSWNDAVRFCNALNKLAGLTNVYDTTKDYWWPPDYTKNGYRLPTEAQYEYACHGGTKTAYWWGPDTNGLGRSAWWVGNANSTTHPVATKLPNGYGLYDMIGNVWQWVDDWSGYYPSDSVYNPTGPAQGDGSGHIMIRGGGWNETPYTFQMLRCANRGVPFHNGRGMATNFLGFRVVLPNHVATATNPGNQVLHTSPTSALQVTTTKGAIAVTLSYLQQGNAEIALYNCNGRQVYRHAGGTMRINTRSWAPGIYSLVVRADGKNYSRMIAVSGQAALAR